MRSKLIVAVLGAGLLAAPAVAQADLKSVVFGRDTFQQFELSEETAAVLDEHGQPVFRARADYVREYADNAQARVWEWDIENARVRITAHGDEPAAWLSCDEVKAMPVACGHPLRVVGDRLEIGRLQGPPPPSTSPYGVIEHGSGSGKGRGYAAAPGRGVPLCPGDPRCARRKGKPPPR